MKSALSAFALVHVILSLVGIFSGFIVVYGLLTSEMPFKVAQLVALLVFLALGHLAARNFRAEELSPA